MTRPWAGEELATAISAFAPGAVAKSDSTAVWLHPDRVLATMQGLRDRREFAFDLLNSVTAVDYIGHFEVVYHLTSLRQNRNSTIKVKCGDARTEAVVPSVVSIWRGADFQEREVYDLMGIKFAGHPNLKRIMLWEGFPGHPLRKDFVTYDQSVVPPEARDMPRA